MATSKDQLLIASKLSKDFWFEEFYEIPVVGKGAQPFHLRNYQKHILSKIDEQNLIIGLKARQIGWTTLAVANALHDVLFFESHPWLLVSRTEDAAIKMLDKAKYAYARLPKWMKDRLPKIRSQTQATLVFDNGSYIEAVPATGSTGRGDSVYGALMDECAFMEYAQEIWAAIEPLVYGKAMLFSTANGMGNFFHEVWLDSQREDSVWEGIFFPWDVVPERDQAWYDHTKASYRGREWFFFQEYPSNPEEAFAKSGRVAFQANLVDMNFEKIEPARKLRWVPGTPGQGHEIPVYEEADIEIYQWKLPEVIRDKDNRPKYKPNYVVACDVAEGLEHGDFTYVTVFDANTGEQVMSSKSAIPVSYLDGLLNWAGEEYMDALIIVERNYHGILPIDRLHRDHWYPRLYRMDNFAQFQTGDRTPRYGWVTSPGTKPKMVDDFVYALGTNQVLLHDPEFVHESRTFVADGKGGYAATSGNHDDVIMGTLIAYQGMIDVGKYPVIWRDPVMLPPTHDDMDELFFGQQTGITAEDVLDQPLGQPEREKVQKSVILMPENWRHWR